MNRTVKLGLVVGAIAMLLLSLQRVLPRSLIEQDTERNIRTAIDALNQSQNGCGEQLPLSALEVWRRVANMPVNFKVVGNGPKRIDADIFVVNEGYKVGITIRPRKSCNEVTVRTPRERTN